MLIFLPYVASKLQVTNLNIEFVSNCFYRFSAVPLQIVKLLRVLAENFSPDLVTPRVNVFLN